jgi:hypothetical protein
VYDLLKERVGVYVVMVSIVEKGYNVANGLVSFFNKKNVVGLNEVFSLGCALHFSSDMSDVF